MDEGKQWNAPNERKSQKTRKEVFVIRPVERGKEWKTESGCQV